MTHSIYTLTVLTYADRHRVWAWFATFEEALHEITTNRAGLDESLYSYAVIERVQSGMIAVSEYVYWAKWDTFAQGWVKCETPARWEHVTGISMG